MNRLFLAAVASLALMTSVAHAEEYKPDDSVMFDVAAENWVTTKTAHVTVNVEAAVSGANAGMMRSDMMKSLDELAKADWRLTSFNRSEDQTGLEHWSAMFDARLAETELNGLADKAKKLSKPGMQLSLGDMDFSPTLDEMEAARGATRAQIYKLANDQLAALNAALPGRNYRIAFINFTSDRTAQPPMPQVVRGMAMMKAMAPAPAEATAPEPMERSEKVTMTARVILSAAPAAATVTPAK